MLLENEWECVYDHGLLMGRGTGCTNSVPSIFIRHRCTVRLNCSLGSRFLGETCLGVTGDTGVDLEEIALAGEPKAHGKDSFSGHIP